jgi:hypothetical protein
MRRQADPRSLGLNPATFQTRERDQDEPFHFFTELPNGIPRTPNGTIIAEAMMCFIEFLKAFDAISSLPFGRSHHPRFETYAVRATCVAVLVLSERPPMLDAAQAVAHPGVSTDPSTVYAAHSLWSLVSPHAQTSFSDFALRFRTLSRSFRRCDRINATPRLVQAARRRLQGGKRHLSTGPPMRARQLVRGHPIPESLQRVAALCAPLGVCSRH